MPGIIWLLRNPIITVFGEHVDEWVDITSDWIARVVAKDLRLTPENIGEDFEAIKSEIKELVDIEIEKIDSMIKGPRYMAVAEGSLDFDVKQCIVTDISMFIDELLGRLEYEALEKIRQMDWRKIRDEDIFKNLAEDVEEDEFEMEESEVTHLEDTLKGYILSIFEEDVRDFVEGKAHLIVLEIKDKKVSDEEIPFFIKDSISEDINKFVYEFEKLKSRYINIIRGEFSIGLKTCKIMPVEEFINKIYRVTFEQTLGLLGKNPEALSKDYFNEEF
jgi:hypothetical protein